MSELTDEQVNTACDLANDLINFADVGDGEASRLACLMAAATYIVETDGDIGFNAGLLRKLYLNQYKDEKEPLQ